MENYAYHYNRKTTPKKLKASPRALLLIFVFLSITLFFTFKKLSSKPASGNQTIIPSVTAEPTKITIKSDSSPSKVMQKLEDILAKSPGTFTVYVYDINQQKGFGFHEDTVYSAASVNKVPILASLYYLADQEKINLEKIVVPQPSDIQDYGSGKIRYDPTGTPYSVRTLARLMMEKSDNTAAYILANVIIGLKKIQNLVDDWGLTQTDITKNKTSASDMAILMIKMYKGEIANSSLTAEMLDFMEKSDYDDRIPKGLPEGTKLYHKTGDDIGKLHDVAIVDLEKHPYYLGIFTTDITDEKKTKETMVIISKTVYEYMKGL